jgi:hypothetical protein
MQKTGGNGCGIKLHVRQDKRYLKRMNQVRLTRGSSLPMMMFERELVSLADDFQIIFGTILGDVRQQLLKLGIQQLL